MLTLELSEKENTALLKAICYWIKEFETEINTRGGIENIDLNLTAPHSLLALSQYGSLIRGLTLDTAAITVKEDAKQYDAMKKDKHVEKEIKLPDEKIKEEIAAIKEKMIDQKDIKNNVEDFTLATLEDYCKNNGDEPERVISRASEILINRHRYELNLLITQLCNFLSGGTSEEEHEIIREFTAKWRENGLGFD